MLTTKLPLSGEIEPAVEEPPQPAAEDAPDLESDTVTVDEVEPIREESPEPVAEMPATTSTTEADTADDSDSETPANQRAERIDWAAEIRNSVRHMRAAQERSAAYLTFDLPEVTDCASTRGRSREVEPRSGQPGPESALAPVGRGNQRLESGDSCFEPIGYGSILVEDAHRFGNVMTFCGRS